MCFSLSQGRGIQFIVTGDTICLIFTVQAHQRDKKSVFGCFKLLFRAACNWVVDWLVGGLTIRNDPSVRILN